MLETSEKKKLYQKLVETAEHMVRQATRVVAVLGQQWELVPGKPSSVKLAPSCSPVCQGLLPKYGGMLCADLLCKGRHFQIHIRLMGLEIVCQVQVGKFF
jgi:hypothetical protein